MGNNQAKKRLTVAELKKLASTPESISAEVREMFSDFTEPNGYVPNGRLNLDTLSDRETPLVTDECVTLPLSRGKMMFL